MNGKSLVYAGLVASLVMSAAVRPGVMAQSSAVLTGVASSQAEGKMEGVVVTARRVGATFDVSVVTDAQGKFSFPGTHLVAGDYALTIRAVGYELATPVKATVGAGKAATADLQLQKAADVSKQLTSVEWMMNLPGSDADKDKAMIQAASCVYCHNIERIVRSSYTTSLSDGQDIEMGVERAQTILDSKLRLGLASITGTPSAAWGGLVPQTVSNANSRVEEIRYEPFAVHNWQINPRMSLESTLVWETSEITQTGDVYNQRSFEFWKPKLDYRFDLTNTFQIRAMAEFQSRQLSFADFVAATDNQDNDANTQAGNSNLEPETFINADLDAEYRLPDDIGVVSAKINFMRHYDKIERIDVTVNEANLQAANGNIGTGDMWQFSVNSSIRMKMINLPNLLATANFQVRDSDIEDPFLGINRRFTNYERGRLDLGFRHDVPQLNMNYGVSWNNRFDGNIKRYDIDDIEVTSGDPMVMAFVEFVAFNGTTFRFDARNATDNLQCRERQRFVGRISSGVLEEIEDQCGGSGRVLSLKINGSF